MAVVNFHAACWCYQMDIPEQEDPVIALFKFF